MDSIEKCHPHASLACERCHRRKKKCDRLIPVCSACTDACVECNYSDQTVGSYPVSYVQSLENKINQMKKRIEELETQQPHLPDTPGSGSVSGSDNDGGSSNGGGGLAVEFGSLSLSANAEGHYLGPGSGISFAQLTQSIMFHSGTDNGGDSEKTIGGGLLVHANPATHLVNNTNPIDETSLPSSERAAEVIEFYWHHSHTLYPIIDREKFMQKFSAGWDETDPVWMFQLYMVLAIGSTAMASVTISSEDEAITCWLKAMTYFNDTLSQGSIPALECLLLLVSYSFFNKLGPDTWYLVGIASRLAMGLGWHSEKSIESAPREKQEGYKRIFWSLYMMDRVVSTTLGRPLAIRDDDVDTQHFKVNEPYLKVTLHILKLRTIAGRILENVYTTKVTRTDEERRMIVNNLHEDLVEWRRTMPFPLNESQYSLVPHLTTAWFDLNYYNFVIMLFRPSPLWPVPPQENLRLLTDAAAMSLQQFSNLCRQRKLSFNWLNLVSVFTACLTLIFITTQPDWTVNYLPAHQIINDLGIAKDLLTQFSARLPPAKACCDVISGFLRDLRTKYDDSTSLSPPSGASNAEFTVDSVLQMFSMANDKYYEDLMAQIDPDFVMDPDPTLELDWDTYHF